MDLQIILPIVLFVLAVNSKDIFDTEGAKKEWNDLSGLSQGILIVNNSIFSKGFLCKYVDNFDCDNLSGFYVHESRLFYILAILFITLMFMLV